MAVWGPRATFSYTDAFKATAARLSELPCVSVQDVGASLYIYPLVFSRWRVSAELKELRQLRKQYEQLKLEHENSEGAIVFTSARCRLEGALSRNTA